MGVSDTIAYDLAADLVDFLTIAAAQIDVDCTIEKFYQTAGRPSVENCQTVAVWVDEISPRSDGNTPADIGGGVCVVGTYVQLGWRLATCINQETTPTVAQHDADAACFDTLAFGLYRRVMVDLSTVFTSAASCRVTSAGPFDVESRSGGTVTGTQLLRVSVDLTRP